MNPAFLDSMSWNIAEVYGAITDQIIINLSHYFKYYKPGDPLPRSAFEYQAAMLAQMGKVNADTLRIIKNGLEGCDEALKSTLEQAIIDSIGKYEPELLKGVKRGILAPQGVPIVAPSQMRAFNLYYEQAADKLNLVNTVMLESTKSAYQQTVSDVVSDIMLSERIEATAGALETAAGEVVTGVSSWNAALKHATDKLNDRGITGFIDHANHHWSAESYVAMDIRTTAFNVGRAAVWEENEKFGNDLYVVSYHDGARPLCYDWQNKVISALNNARDVTDLDGNVIHVYAQSETTYGEPAGLFGINCKHYPTPFIPGVSLIRGQPQSEEDNARTYKESQEQRRLERQIREEKKDLLAAKAKGATREQINYLESKVKETSESIDRFCDNTGRARHRDREAVYTKREFPDARKYDVSEFERKQKERIDTFFAGGGVQTGRTFGVLTPNVPLTPGVPVVPGKKTVTKQTPTKPRKYDTFQNAKGLTDDFKVGMAKTLDGCGNKDAKKLFEKYADGLNCVNPSSRGKGANYASWRGGVTMNLKRVAAGSEWETPYEVAFHEFGHMIDDLAGPNGKYLSNVPINGQRLLHVIESDYADFKAAIGAATHADVIAALKAEPMSKDARICGNISDILEKCTGKSYPFGIGHGKSYHNRPGATEREFFAEVLDSAIANQPSYKQMERLFPNAVKMVWDMIKGVTK